jgi:Zn-dependent M28 family amino/carboxypeptidase
MRHSILIAAGLAACSACLAQTPGTETYQASADRMMETVRVLSSDAFEGRAPGSAGEELTVKYLVDQLKALGLKPGNGDSYIQPVPMVGIVSQTSAQFTTAGATSTPAWINDYIAVSRHVSPKVEVKDSDVVFVGYGVVAPEYGWDDFKGVDVKGKTVVMLINDPPVRDPKDPTKLDDTMFKGKAMTYYGRWTYKYEEASAKGAAACIIVHETGPAGYPFAVVAGSWGRENFSLETPDGDASRVAVEGWVTLDYAKKLFAAAGYDYETLKAAAVSKDFHPVDLKTKASFTIANTIRPLNSKNVVAKLDGADPKVKDEYVIVSAHWDHLGRNPKLKGDQIFHGALDNATGTAGLLEIARKFSLMPESARPRRTVLFLVVTAEEQGLLGSAYYASHPIYPLDHTLADVNMDGLQQWGPTTDVQGVGYGNSTIDDIAAAMLKDEGRQLIPEEDPEKGSFYRSDHFEFAKVGVPAFYTKSGTHIIGKPEGYGRMKRDGYTANDYHKVTDVIKPDWDLYGGALDADLLYRISLNIAQTDTWPQWKPGCEFKARRDAMMAAAAH